MTTQSPNQDRRAPGRPVQQSAEEVRERLVEAAAHEFQSKGYAQTKMQAVASRAGISTRTLYKHVANKAELAAMTAEQWVAQQRKALEAHHDPALPPQQSLARLISAYAELLLRPEALQLAQMIVRERDAFPEVHAIFHTFSRQLSAEFDQRLAAILNIQTPPPNADLLRSLIHGLQRQALLGLTAPMDHTQLTHWARRASQMFLTGAQR